MMISFPSKYLDSKSSLYLQNKFYCMKATFKNCLHLRSFYEQVVRTTENPEDVMPLVQLKKLVKKIIPQLEEIEEAVEDLRLDHCYKEGSKIIRTEQGGFTFTADGEKAFRKAHKELMNKEISLPEFNQLSYEELAQAISPKFAKANPWEDMGPVLAPFYCEKHEPLPVEG